MIYRATVRDDEDLRIRAQEYYRETFGQEIPLEQFTCLGVHSDVVFPLCRECPWVQCCRRHGIVSCEACKDYPCAALREYRTKYVESYPITES